MSHFGKGFKIILTLIITRMENMIKYIALSCYLFPSLSKGVIPKTSLALTLKWCLS